MTNPDRLTVTAHSTLHPSARPDARPSMSDHEWMTYAELGVLLGLRSDGARAWAKRRKLQTRIDADGRARVRAGADVLAERAGGRSGKHQTERRGERPADRQGEVSQLQAELVRAQAERDGALARLADRDREVERLYVLLTDHGRERERMQVLLQAEQQQVKALTDQRQKPSWWRWWLQR